MVSLFCIWPISLRWVKYKLKFRRLQNTIHRTPCTTPCSFFIHANIYRSLRRASSSRVQWKCWSWHFSPMRDFVLNGHRPSSSNINLPLVTYSPHGQCKSANPKDSCTKYIYIWLEGIEIEWALSKEKSPQTLIVLYTCHSEDQTVIRCDHILHKQIAKVLQFQSTHQDFPEAYYNLLHFCNKMRYNVNKISHL